MDCEDGFAGNCRFAYFASSAKTLAYSPMKSIATSTASAADGVVAGCMTTQGLWFLRAVTDFHVLLTSAVTREKLFLASARPMVGAGMVSPVFRLLRLLSIWAKLGLYNRLLSNSWRQVRMANPCGEIKR